MKKIYILLIILVTVDVSAQSIRKPSSELTPSEQIAFVTAINQLSGTMINEMSSEHQRMFNDSHADAIHVPQTFLPWHRIFLRYLEVKIQAISPDLALPYWDWYEKSPWSIDDPLFMDANSAHDGLFVQDVNLSVWNYTRHVGTSWTPPTHNEATTDFATFTNSLEGGPHNSGHNFIGGGGTMSMMISPNDPMFYLHHCMVDKEWADWYELHSTANVSVLRTDMYTFNIGGHAGTRVNGRNYINPRVDDVWYAKNGSVTLDKDTANGNKRYRYTTGTIIAKDNFVIASGANVTMQALNSVKFQVGFKASAGSHLMVSLITAGQQLKSAPIITNSFADNDNLEESQENQANNSSDLFTINVYPNPSTGTVHIAIQQSNSEYNFVKILDLNGKIVLESGMIGNTELILDLTDKPKGVYLVQVVGASGSNYERFILQ